MLFSKSLYFKQRLDGHKKHTEREIIDWCHTKNLSLGNIWFQHLKIRKIVIEKSR